MTYADFAAQDLPILHQYWTQMMELPKVPALAFPPWGWGCLCGETTLTAVPGSPRSCHQSTSPSTGPNLLLLCTPPPVSPGPELRHLPAITEAKLKLLYNPFPGPKLGLWPAITRLLCCSSAPSPRLYVMVLPTITRAPLLLLCIPPAGLQAGALTCQTWATAVLWPPPGATIPKAGYCCTPPSEPKPPLHPLNPGTIPLFPPHPQPESLWQSPETQTKVPQEICTCPHLRYLHHHHNKHTQNPGATVVLIVPDPRTPDQLLLWASAPHNWHQEESPQLKLLPIGKKGKTEV